MNYSNLKQLLVCHEGQRVRTYKDTRGKRTIGVGFNLDAPGAAETFRALLPSVNYTNIYNGIVALTTDQVQTLFDHSIAVAVEDAKALVPSFDVQPENAQLVLVDMAFNMGRHTLAGFRHFLGAIETERYAEAVAHLRSSAWYHQVNHRAQDDIALLTQLATHRTFQPEVSSAQTKGPVSASHT